MLDDKAVSPSPPVGDRTSDMLEIYTNVLDANILTFGELEKDIEEFNSRYEYAVGVVRETKSSSSYGKKTEQDEAIREELRAARLDASEALRTIKEITRMKRERSSFKAEMSFSDSVISATRTNLPFFSDKKEDIEAQLPRLIAIVTRLSSGTHTAITMQTIRAIDTLIIEKKKLLVKQGVTMDLRREVRYLENEIKKYQDTIAAMEIERNLMKKVYLAFGIFK